MINKEFMEIMEIFQRKKIMSRVLIYEEFKKEFKKYDLNKEIKFPIRDESGFDDIENVFESQLTNEKLKCLKEDGYVFLRMRQNIKPTGQTEYGFITTKRVVGSRVITFGRPKVIEVFNRLIIY